VAAVARPSATIDRHTSALRPRTRGRAIASNKNAAAVNRSAPVPAGPNAAKTVVASAAAVCSDTQLATMHAGPVRRWATAGRAGVAHRGPAPGGAGSRIATAAIARR
jgi:hypothetical protein